MWFLLLALSGTSWASCPHEKESVDKFSKAQGHSAWVKSNKFSWLTFIHQSPPVTTPDGRVADKWVTIMVRVRGIGSALPADHRLSLLLEDGEVVDLPVVATFQPTATVTDTESTATVTSTLKATYQVSDEQAGQLAKLRIESARLVKGESPILTFDLSGTGSKGALAAAACVFPP
jgi:hypothetical protein